jgi:glycine/D-amino acid oxidase-like deaminating enzyme
MESTDGWDVIVVGAGAAGLFAATAAAGRGRRTLLLEKNRRPGIKILMSGGTRCNVTQATDERGIVKAFGRQGPFLHSALAWPVKKLVLTRFFDVVILFLLRSRFPALVPSGCDMVKAVHEYLSPPHKIIAMLKKGRDELRVKYRELMEQRRTAENQVRAVEKSRAMWRARAEAAEAELQELKKKATCA